MGKAFTVLGLILGLSLTAVGAGAWRFLDHHAGGPTAFTIAGGLFTVALAAALEG